MRAYQLLADILEYPSPRLAAQIGECLPLLPPAAAGLLEDFRAFVEQADGGQLEELYTSSFDLQPDCSLYVGYQVFGEDRRRGPFMARLREEYRTRGFSDGGELPDHLAVILRYLARRRPDDEPDEMIAELIAECVLPAVSKLVQTLAARQHPYAPVLQAIATLLQADKRGPKPIEQTAGILQPQ
jgi:nitrate reductase delta subunit